MSHESAPAPAMETPDGRTMARLLALAIALGVLGALGASVFLVVVEKGQELVYSDLPSELGLDGVPWWWAGILLLIGAAVIAVAQRLPGGTGSGPLTGFHFDTPLPVVPSILIAAAGSLIFGFSLGPEAPLIILGTAIGAIVTRRAGADARQIAMLLGGVAAIGAVFGNPFITGFMILEFAAFGLIPGAVLIPVFVALGSGYLVLVGVAGIPGVGVHSLSVPGLPAYPSIQFGDLVFGVIVALVTAVIAMAVREFGQGIDRVAQRYRVPVLFGAALLSAAAYLVASQGFGIGVEEILFSGNTGMATLVKETSLGAVIAIVVFKSVAYGTALGGGMRGGPIFPATFLGVAVGVGAALVFGEADLSPLAAVGIAASAAVFTKLPATSALLGALLISGTGAAIAPFAILGAVIGFLIRMAGDKLIEPPAEVVERNSA